MSTEVKPLVDLTRRAIQVLSREFGPADAIRFLNQYSSGHGDYTAERDALFAGLTLERMLADLRASGGEAAG